MSVQFNSVSSLSTRLWAEHDSTASCTTPKNNGKIVWH